MNLNRFGFETPIKEKLHNNWLDSEFDAGTEGFFDMFKRKGSSNDSRELITDDIKKKLEAISLKIFPSVKKEFLNHHKLCQLAFDNTLFYIVKRLDARYMFEGYQRNIVGIFLSLPIDMIEYEQDNGGIYIVNAEHGTGVGPFESKDQAERALRSLCATYCRMYYTAFMKEVNKDPELKALDLDYGSGSTTLSNFGDYKETKRTDDKFTSEVVYIYSKKIKKK